ncbi:hypothetical protein AB0I84_36895, partial [Streptomyces spectabilis]|uniref:hypothetical protein n=1 Tax=Streptomyces spectabilis TaxID=68270 RepID=UPI0033C6D0C1
MAVSAVMVGTLLQAAATSTATADSGGRPGLPSAEKPVAGRDGAKAEPRKTDPGPTTPSRKPKAA